jgi:hypothetical protein
MRGVVGSQARNQGWVNAKGWFPGKVKSYTIKDVGSSSPSPYGPTWSYLNNVYNDGD